MRPFKYFLYLSSIAALFMNHPAWGKPDAAAINRESHHSRKPASPSMLSWLALPKRFDAGGPAQALLAQKDVRLMPSQERFSDRRVGARLELEQERTIPKLGTLQPAYRYTDVTVKFR